MGQQSERGSSDGTGGKRSWPAAYVLGLNESVTGNAQAFGFSITVTVTFGALAAAQGNPTRAEVVGFALSGVAAFSLLNLVVAHLVRNEPSGAPGKRALLISTATDFLAVGAAVGVAIWVSAAVTGWGGWVLAPFGSGLVYVLVQSAELMVGRREADPDDG